MVFDHDLGAGAAASEETVAFERRVREAQAWMDQPRFAGKTRPYTASQVVTLQGTFPMQYASKPICEQLYAMLRQHQQDGTCSHTFGALDTVQVTQMAESLSTVYVSGWQSSSTAATSNEPGPDVADYPYDTVPNKVDQLFRAQLFHDRKQFEERMRQTEEWRVANPPINFLNPIIADADTGHGGLTAAMKLTKMFVERGASGIHLEDQKAGTKKCGHMGGKVLVSVEEHCQRLIAARLQADIMNYPLIVVARTDADAATLLDSNIDPRDHPFIKGATTAGVESLIEATHAGKSGDWSERAGEKTYVELMKELLTAEQFADFESKCYDIGLEGMKALAKSFGVEPYFDWEKARTPEGYYRIQGSTKYCSQRGKAFSKYADMIWMETGKPTVSQAKEFADDILSMWPKQMLAYNLSPSFNWDAAGMTDEEMRTFIWDIAKLGFCWQFITLAGFHVDSLGITDFSRAYAKDGMLAYVSMVQRQERERKVSTLRHQKWSGAELTDVFTNVITAGKTSTGIMSAGVTEAQFGK